MLYGEKTDAHPSITMESPIMHLGEEGLIHFVCFPLLEGKGKKSEHESKEKNIAYAKI